jgi:hypothetical protein
MSDGSSKLIAIDEEPNHQIVHGRRFGEANGATHETPNSINLNMPAECVSQSPHGICARDVSHQCKSVFSGLSVCGDQQNPYVEVSKTLKIKTGSPRLIEGSSLGYNTPISIIAFLNNDLHEIEDQISGTLSA